MVRTVGLRDARDVSLPPRTMKNRPPILRGSVPRRDAPSSFVRRVLAVVSRIPPGRIATYGDVAAAAGFEGAARAVGTVMRTCRRPDLPCHRVVAAGGRLGGYGGNTALKQVLLRHEGVTVVGTRIRNFGDRRWPSRDTGKAGHRKAVPGRNKARS
jgi:methylated-DNA-[protein]-cysteine S-methyltransferase